MVRRKEQTTCERRGPLAHPPSLGFLGALGRWHSAARTERVSGNAAPGRLLSRSGLRANQNGLMPRRGWQEIKVKAPDTMGPLSVSSQLTFKQRFHPPSPLLPIPVPCHEVTQTYGLLSAPARRKPHSGSYPRRARLGRPGHGLSRPPGGDRAPHFRGRGGSQGARR